MCGPAQGVVFLTHPHQMRKHRRIVRTAAVLLLLLLCNFVNADTRVSSVSIPPLLFWSCFSNKGQSRSYVSNLGLLHRAAGLLSSPAPVMVASRCFSHTLTGSCELPDFCVALQMLLVVISQTMRCSKETVTSCLHDCLCSCVMKYTNTFTCFHTCMYLWYFSLFALFSDLISQIVKVICR